MATTESFEKQIAAGLMVELFPGRLYFTSLGFEPRDTDEAAYIGVPLEMLYIPYFADFGPLNLGHVVQYCRIVCEALARSSNDALNRLNGSNTGGGGGGGGSAAAAAAAANNNTANTNTNQQQQRVTIEDPRLGGTSAVAGSGGGSGAAAKAGGILSSSSAAAYSSSQQHQHHQQQQPFYQKVVLYSPHKTYERANAACLVGCFCVAVLQYSADYVNRLFSRCYPHFLPFRDASYGVANYNLHLVDCWAGFKKAWDLGWVSMDPWVEAMGVERHEYLRQLAKGGGVGASAGNRSRAGTATSSAANNSNKTAGRVGSSSSSPSSSAITQETIRSQFEAVMHPADPLLPIIVQQGLTLYQFDLEAYQFYEKLENGDWNWIVPGQILAFSSPIDAHPHRTAISYVPMFRSRRVMMVVRLNERDIYNEKAFTNQGIRHLDCNYADGSVPCDAIVEKFLSNVAPLLQRTNEVGGQRWLEQQRNGPQQSSSLASSSVSRNEGSSSKKRTISSRQRPMSGASSYVSSATAADDHHAELLAASLRRPPTAAATSGAASKALRESSLGGAVAVHCKAGLGRTGTLISIYLMLHYHFTARECIGWLRICRPGCVLGEQQAFLEQFETRVVRAKDQQAQEQERARSEAERQGVLLGLANRTAGGGGGTNSRGMSTAALGSGASFLGDGRGAATNQKAGPTSPTKKETTAICTAAAAPSSSRRPSAAARSALNAQFGGIGGKGAPLNGLSGLRAALGTDDRLLGLNVPLTASSARHAASSSSSSAVGGKKKAINSKMSVDDSLSSSASSPSASPSAGLPLTMRSATPTTSTAVAMLKVVPKLGNAHLQRLPMNRTAAAGGGVLTTAGGMVVSDRGVGGRSHNAAAMAAGAYPYGDGWYSAASTVTESSNSSSPFSLNTNNNNKANWRSSGQQQRDGGLSAPVLRSGGALRGSSSSTNMNAANTARISVSFTAFGNNNGAQTLNDSTATEGEEERRREEKEAADNARMFPVIGTTTALSNSMQNVITSTTSSSGGGGNSNSGAAARAATAATASVFMPFGSAHQQFQPSRSFGAVRSVCGELLSGTASPPKKMRVAPPTGATPIGDWTVARPGAPKKYVNV